jgi:hypothetical protein
MQGLYKSVKSLNLVYLFFKGFEIDYCFRTKYLTELLIFSLNCFFKQLVNYQSMLNILINLLLCLNFFIFQFHLFNLFFKFSLNHFDIYFQFEISFQFEGYFYFVQNSI